MTAPSDHIYIVTGASRGLGRAIAEQLAAIGATVLGLSRQAPAAAFEQWPCDLSDPLQVASRLSIWLGHFDPTKNPPICIATFTMMFDGPRGSSAGWTTTKR